MSGYQPVYRSILDSTIARDYVVRHVYEDLLKLADYRTAVVDMTIDAIARRTNAPEEMVRHGIEELEKPDPESRCKLEGGRRIVRLDPERPWGWRIVTYALHQEEVKRDGNRRRQADYRERKTDGIKRPPGRPRKPVTEGALPSVTKRRRARREKPVTEGRIKKEERRIKNEEIGAGPPSRSSAEDGAAASLFERLRKEAGGEDFFEEFMTEEKYRIARELMQERPAVFEKISIEDLATLWNGGTLRGTKHDRRAMLLWARDPDGFHMGGALSGPTKRDRRAAAIYEGGPW